MRWPGRFPGLPAALPASYPRSPSADSAPPPAALRGRRRWLWGAAAVLLGVLVAWVLVYFGLDPWLRRQLEQQVTTQTHGCYHLRVGALRTRFADRSLTLSRVRLRPARPFTAADSLPVLRFDLPRLQVTGIDLLALWRRRPQQLNELIVSGLMLQIDSLPAPAADSARPLHQRLPARVPGLHLGHLILQNVRAAYAGRRRPRAAVARLDLEAHDLRLTAAGAADTTRLLYARAWQGHLRGARAGIAHHRLRVGRLDFDTRPGHLTLDSLRVRPTHGGRRGPAYLTLRVGHGRLSGLRAAALLRQRFHADSLAVKGLQFDLKAPATPPPLPHELVAKWFPRFFLADARLTEGQVRVRGVSRLPVIRGLQLHATGLRLTATAWRNPALVYYARTWALQTGAGHTLVDAPYYRVAWAEVRAESATGLLIVNSLRLAPTMGLAEMARRKGHEVSHITLAVPQVRATAFDFNALLHRRGLLIGNVVLQAPACSLRNDGRYATNPAPSVVTPETLGKLKFRVNIRRLTLAGGTLRFWYRGPLSPVAATGHLTALHGTLTNVTNDPAGMDAAHPMRAQAGALLQGSCPVQANGTFNLLDPRGRHHLTGTLGPAAAGLLNPVLEPASLVRVQTGTVQSLRVTMTGDRAGVRGELRAAYQNLHIRLLKPPARQTLWTKLKSKVVNKVIIHDDNPDHPGQPLRVGQIQSSRELRFSVFALWKQGLINGILRSIGLTEAQARPLSAAETQPPK